MAALSLLLAFSTAPVGLAGQAPDEPLWLAAVRTWAAAVNDHEPGKADTPVIGADGWSARDLATVITDVLALRDILAKRHARNVAPPAAIDYSDHHFTIPAIADLLGLTRDEATRGDFNRLLKRAAILHTDVVTLTPLQTTATRTLGAQMLRSEDGQARGYSGTVHWEVARRLLDAVAPTPSTDPFVRAWYLATTAYLQGDANLAYAEPQLARAREIFPNDAEFLFATGCLHEAYASPLVQTLVRSVNASVALDVNSAENHWRQAERFFRQAVAADPGRADARLRLGRVSGLLGRHQDAIAELQQALKSSADPLLHYYGDLFLGGEMRAIGNDEVAREHYQRAADAYPRAPSPQIALSDIGHRQGDRAAALAAIARAFEATADRQHAADPWWEYYLVAFRDADQQLAMCRREVQTRKQP